MVVYDHFNHFFAAPDIRRDGKPSPMKTPRSLFQLRRRFPDNCVIRRFSATREEKYHYGPYGFCHIGHGLHDRIGALVSAWLNRHGANTGGNVPDILL